MNKFFIIANLDKDPELAMSKTVAEYITKRGCFCGYLGIYRRYGDNSAQEAALKSIPLDTEAVIVLGGDGTIIQVASPLAKAGIPIIGINMGNLGYLAEVDKDNYEPVLDRLIADDYQIEERMMLHGRVIIGGEKVNTSRALNEIVIARTGALRVVKYEIYVNDKLLGTYDADGIIVSTPTGSTGYNMSAGGPIVEPDARVILITPVAAHTLNSRSIVLSPYDRLRVAVAPSRNDSPHEVQICFDGGIWFKANPGDYVEIEQAQRKTRVIKMSKESFLDTLSRKISS